MADTSPTIFLPEPPSLGDIASGYADTFRGLTGMAADAAINNTSMALQYGDQILAGNYARFPKVIDAATKSSITASSSLNRDLSSQYYRNLANADPNWQQNISGNTMQSSADSAGYAMDNLMRNLPSMLTSAYGDMQMLQRASRENLSGMIPQDIVNSASMFAAEKARKQGVFGQAANNMVAKELGLQSLSSLQTGIQNAGQSFEAGVNPFLNQLATLQQAQQATGNAATVAGALKAPMINAGSIFGANFGQLTGTSMMSPGVAASGLIGLQGAGMNAAVGLWGNQAQFNQSQIQQGYNAQNYVAAQELLNKKPSPWGSVIGGAASGAATGSAIAPGWGTVIGGVVGAGVGYFSSQQ